MVTALKAKIASPWHCPTCDRAVLTPFCSGCGERPLVQRDLAVKGLLDQVLRAFSSIDGRLLRSLRCLLAHPGSLTLAYLRGQRKPYFGPLQLFLAANLLFFLAQTLTSTNIFSSSLDSHLQAQDWSALAQEMVSKRLEATHRTVMAYAPEFNRAAVFNAKSLIVLMALTFALLLPIAFFKSRQPFVAHAVFALHLYAFLLIFFCVALFIATASRWSGGPGLESAAMDNTLSALNLLACGSYLTIAIGRVYGDRGWARVIKVVALCTMAAAIALGYRFVVFVITLYTS